MPRSRVQLEQAAADAEAWLDQLDPADPNITVDDPADLRAIAYALAAVASAEQAVSQSVAAARKNGRTWGDIAMILGISRQAAQKRYGDPATVVPIPR
ncbi:MAG: sigma-70 family RNA polymerase sigma factor [Pseudonocardiaceae bacterium]